MKASPNSYKSTAEEKEHVDVNVNINVKTYIEQTVLCLNLTVLVMMYSNVSIFEGFSLINYIEANRYICCNRHAQPCVLCSAMLEVAQRIHEVKRCIPNSKSKLRKFSHGQ